jgi:hypothetical protein
MSDRRPIVTDHDLVNYEAWAKVDLRGNLGQQAAARRILELLEEVRLARRLVRGLYAHIPDVQGQEDLQAELERYAGELGVVRPGPATTR